MSLSIGAALALATVGACGGKAPSPAVGNAGGGAPAIAAPQPGIHACAFTHEGYTYGPHRCDVVAGDPLRLDKLSGMELFTGTLAVSPDGLVLTGTGGCADMGTACGKPFTVTLTRDGDAWRGTVAADGSDWWLAGATFEITDQSGYGGAGYGGDGYGGAGYAD